MPSIRPSLTVFSTPLGKRLRTPMQSNGSRARTTVGEDVRLFGLTFASGFVFMMVYLA